MKLRVAALTALTLGGSIVAVGPAAGASVTGQAAATSTVAARAGAARAGAARTGAARAGAAPVARCLGVDRLTPRGSAASAIRYWTSARTASAMTFSQARFARAQTSPHPLQARSPEPSITHVCLPASTAVPRHGTSKPPAVRATRAIDGYKTVGKLFVELDGVTSNCTASVIDWDIIVTAAHCFKGEFGSIKYTTADWMFAPMWHDNKFPYGKWSVRSVYLAHHWISDLNTRYDYAIVVLHRRNGHNVAFYTGQDSWSSSLSLPVGNSTPVRAVGIPAHSKKALVSVTNAFAVQVGPGFVALRASTPGFAGGTSGGPWFSPFATTTDTGTIIGVTGGYQAGGKTDSPSYADFLTKEFADLMAAALESSVHCRHNGACRFWP